MTKIKTEVDDVAVPTVAVVAETTPTEVVQAEQQPKVIFSKSMAGFLLMRNGVLFKVDRDKKDAKRSTFIYRHDERLNESLALYSKVEPIIKALKYGDDALLDKLLAIVQDNKNEQTEV
jgi:hypothetical protein